MARPLGLDTTQGLARGAAGGPKGFPKSQGVCEGLEGSERPGPVCDSRHGRCRCPLAMACRPPATFDNSAAPPGSATTAQFNPNSTMIRTQLLLLSPCHIHRELASCMAPQPQQPHASAPDASAGGCGGGGGGGGDNKGMKRKRQPRFGACVACRKVKSRWYVPFVRAWVGDRAVCGVKCCVGSRGRSPVHHPKARPINRCGRSSIHPCT